MDQLMNLDFSILMWINSWQLPSSIHDTLLFITNATRYKWFLFGVVPVVCFLFFLKHKWRGARIAAGALLLVGSLDVFSYRLIKSVSHRDRPQHAHAEVNLRLGHSPKSSSFPSNHSIATMALAVWIFAFFPISSMFFFFIAIATGLSRIYVGVHYPSDVLAGWLVGAVGATLALCFVRKYIDQGFVKKGTISESI